MADTTLAADLSNYTPIPSADQLAAWRSDGYGLGIIQAIDPPAGYPSGRTPQQIEALLEAGFTVDIYVWLWFDADLSDIQHKLSLLAGNEGRINRIWLDVEDTAAAKYTQPVTEQKVRDALTALDAFPTLSGRPAGVYTGRWFWADGRYMGNTTAFADRDLWDAHYDGDASSPAAGYIAYGGWAKPAYKQFRGTTTLEGVGNVDLDIVDGVAIQPLSVNQPVRETPDDYPFANWRQSAIAYKGALDAMGQQLVAAQAQVAQLQALNDATLKAQVQDLQARIHTAVTALGAAA